MSRHIACLLPDMRGGGAERISLDLGYAFRALGYRIEFVLMTAKGELLPEARRDFSVHELGAQKVRAVPALLSRYLTVNQPAAVIAHMWPLTTAAVVGRSMSRHRCPLLVVEHCTLSRQYASWGMLHRLALQASIAFSYRLADRVAAVSAGSARDLASIACLPEDRTTVLHNPIPRRGAPSERARAEADAIWGCPPGERILSVGTFKAQKNHGLLLRAFAQLPRPQSKLLLLGHGEDESMLRALASELGVLDRVIMPGFCSEPAPFYATADLFALSSDYEGLPTVLVEALSFGLRIVSTDCPSGPAEILENGRWGRLCAVGDVTAFSHAMDQALSTPVDAEPLIRRAADFAPETAARKYLDVLGLT